MTKKGFQYTSKHGIKIGTDPELFVKKNGEFVSAHGLVNGTKQSPEPVKFGAVQVDGMALEFNIEPASNHAEFHRNHEAVIGQLKSMVGEEYEFVFEPTATFSDEVMKSQPTEALLLGCEPDFNAWENGAVNKSPCGDGKNFRTGSGHIHIGWGEGIDINDPEHIEACCQMTRALDRFLYPISFMWDHDEKRRELYGNAGAFRPKSYGVEYRVLSNKWVNDPYLRDLVFSVVSATFDKLMKQLDWGSHNNFYSPKEFHRNMTTKTSKERHTREMLSCIFGGRNGWNLMYDLKSKGFEFKESEEDLKRERLEKERKKEMLAKLSGDDLKYMYLDTVSTVRSMRPQDPFEAAWQR